jgi:hypothetical protein
VIEYQVPDREGETGNRQLKTYLRGPGKVLRSQKPEMIRQEIYDYLLTHYAISADLPDRHRRRGPTAPIRGSSSAPATTPTASKTQRHWHTPRRPGHDQAGLTSVSSL